MVLLLSFAENGENFELPGASFEVARYPLGSIKSMNQIPTYPVGIKTLKSTFLRT